VVQQACQRAHSQTDARPTRSIRESFELSDRTYGSPRVWHDLKAAGEQCGINRVARLMKLANLQARRQQASSRQRDEVGKLHCTEPSFSASSRHWSLNQKWVADFTYIWTAEGWLYAAAVMDLYSRRIVGCQ
jgi:putative transposase